MAMVFQFRTCERFARMMTVYLRLEVARECEGDGAGQAVERKLDRLPCPVPLTFPCYF